MQKCYACKTEVPDDAVKCKSCSSFVKSIDDEVEERIKNGPINFSETILKIFFGMLFSVFAGFLLSSYILMPITDSLGYTDTQKAKVWNDKMRMYGSAKWAREFGTLSQQRLLDSTWREALADLPSTHIQTKNIINNGAMLLGFLFYFFIIERKLLITRKMLYKAQIQQERKKYNN